MSVPYNDVIRKLRSITESVPLSFSKGAQQLFVEWYSALRNRLLTDDLTDQMRHHLGKYQGLFARLCIPWHLTRMVERDSEGDPSEVSLETARDVRTFIDESPMVTLQTGQLKDVIDAAVAKAEKADKDQDEKEAAKS